MPTLGRVFYELNTTGGRFNGKALSHIRLDRRKYLRVIFVGDLKMGNDLLEDATVGRGVWGTGRQKNGSGS